MTNARILRFNDYHAKLIDAQRSREFMPIQDMDTPYWNMYEKLLMWKLVNQTRNALDKDLVPFSDIERIEQSAAGHIDYTKKFALYCAELVDKE
jgi:hypothetical protein